MVSYPVLFLFLSKWTWDTFPTLMGTYYLLSASI